MLNKRLTCFLFALGVSAIPAFAGVTVNSPAANSQVSSPFNLSAYASQCSGQNIASMGYSLDSSTSTTIFYSSSINTSVSAASGGHTVHVKSWGNSGAVCVSDVAIIVSTASAIPSIASSVSSIQALTSWIGQNDSASSGSAAGSMSITSSPSMSGAARRFSTSYWNYGSERYSTTFADDTGASNFLFDTWVYIANPSTGIANLELDLNQVLSNGQTMLYGFQCDGWSGTWDYTVNKGTATNFNDQWVHSSAGCNVRSWSTNTWHHVQISYSRNNSGWITYKYVTLDGNQQNINATVYGAFALGWGPTLLVNVQVDGATSGTGSSTVYVDDLTIYRW
jgi:hypothetical protein